jgi:hypothetical protein
LKVDESGAAHLFWQAQFRIRYTVCRQWRQCQSAQNGFLISHNSLLPNRATGPGKLLGKLKSASGFAAIAGRGASR